MNKVFNLLVIAVFTLSVSCSDNQKSEQEGEAKDSLKEKVLQKAKTGRASEEFDKFAGDSNSTDSNSTK